MKGQETKKKPQKTTRIISGDDKKNLNNVPKTCLSINLPKTLLSIMLE